MGDKKGGGKEENFNPSGFTFLSQSLTTFVKSLKMLPPLMPNYYIS